MRKRVEEFDVMRTSLRNLLYVAMLSLGAVSLNACGADRETIQFIASQSGVSLQGIFNGFAANIKFDPAHPEVGTVQARVDVGSVSTGTSSADELLRSEDFFDAKTHPQATFEATEFHAQDKGHYQAKGTFTLKGHSISLPVTFTTTDAPQGRWFDGTFTISRLIFQVGLGEWSDTSTLDDAVRVQFHILQAGVAPPH
jgi:polyisoprenoid-binding protein YceI